MLFWNGDKQLQTEKKFVTDIISKIKKSKIAKRESTERTEKFKFDDFDVCFNWKFKNERGWLSEDTLIVQDKTGKEFMSIDCHHDSYDRTQDVRQRIFERLLNVCVKQDWKIQDKEEKLQAAADKVKKKTKNSVTMPRGYERVREL